jgi:hypothetical protein
MKEQKYYYDNLKARRDFFQANFPIKIGRQRTDVNSLDILKNSCPVCGYLTLDERDAFDICGICFWEDDGIDDFEENQDSGPNHMTLKEGRLIFRRAKQKLLSTENNVNVIIDELKRKFLSLDSLINQNSLDKDGVISQQNEIIDLLRKNRVYGLEKLFGK